MSCGSDRQVDMPGLCTAVPLNEAVLQELLISRNG